MVFLENVYYIIIVAWTLYYIMNTFFSLGSGLPWSDCEKGGQQKEGGHLHLGKLILLLLPHKQSPFTALKGIDVFLENVLAF